MMKIINRLCLINKTLIIKFDIKKVIAIFDIPTVDGFYFRECISGKDINDIVEFYTKNNNSLYSSFEEVEAELQKSRFFAVYNSEHIVAGMWIHEGIVDITAPSFEALKLRHKHVVKFEENVVYSSHNLVDKSFRGQGLYTMLLLNTLYHIRNKKYYIIITGYGNKKMVESSCKYLGQIIGAMMTIRLFKYLWIRKTLIPIIEGGYWKSIIK